MQARREAAELQAAVARAKAEHKTSESAVWALQTQLQRTLEVC